MQRTPSNNLPGPQRAGWLRDTPMLRVLAPFASGLAASPVLPVHHYPVEALCLTAILLYAVGTRFSPLVRTYALRWWSGLLAAAACLALGLSVGTTEHLLRSADTTATDGSGSWEGTCLLKTLQTPDFSGNGSPWANVQARFLSHGPSPGKRDLATPLLSGQKVLLSIKGMDTLPAGSTLLCALAIQRPTAAGHPVDFDQRAYLASQSVYWQARMDSSQYQVLQRGHGLRHAINRLRTYSLGALNRSVPDAQAGAVLSALCLGWKEELNKESLQAFSRAGTLHILAVSGMHVGLVYLLLQKILGSILVSIRKPTLKRYIEGLLAISGVWTFVMISGAPPSAMRAGLLFSLMAFSRLIHRKSGGKNAWAGTAFLLLLLQPSLLYSVGFQLSFSAVAGILWTYPWFRARIIMKGWLGKHLSDLLALSLAAQLGCLSLSWHYFGQFPVHFLLGNLVGVPLVGLFLLGSALLIALPPWPVTLAFADLLSWFVNGWLELMERVGNLPGAILTMPQLPAMAALTMFLSMLCWFSSNPVAQPARTNAQGAGMLLLLALAWTAYRANQRHNGEWLIASCWAEQYRLELVAGGLSIPIIGQTGSPSKAARWRGADVPVFHAAVPMSDDDNLFCGHPESGMLPLQFGASLIQCFSGSDEGPLSAKGVVLVQDGWPPKKESAPTPQDSIWYGADCLQILLAPQLTKRQRQVWITWCKMHAISCEVLPRFGSREWRLAKCL